MKRKGIRVEIHSGDLYILRPRSGTIETISRSVNFWLNFQTRSQKPMTKYFWEAEHKVKAIEVGRIKLYSLVSDFLVHSSFPFRLLFISPALNFYCSQVLFCTLVYILQCLNYILLWILNSHSCHWITQTHSMRIRYSIQRSLPHNSQR